MALRRREFLILGGVGVVAAAAGMLVGPMVLQSRSGASELLSARFSDLSGTVRTLGEWNGKILVCNFWATWCPPCVEEVPLLARTRGRYVDKGVEVVGIAIDSAKNVAKFLRSMNVEYPQLIGGADGLDLLRKLGNKAGGLPFTVILDRSGSVAETKLGAYKGPELESTLLRLIAA